MRRMFVSALAGLLAVSGAVAQAQTAPSPEGAGSALVAGAPERVLSRELVLYQGGFGVVEERRELAEAGARRFGGLADTLRPETLTVTGEAGVGVSDIRWAPAALDRSRILRRFIGHTVLLVPRSGVSASQRSATLLALDGDMPVVHVDGQVEFGGEGAPWRLALPLEHAPVVGRPLALQASAAGVVRIRYLADGLGWSADHVLELDGDSASVESMATLRNDTGTPLPGSRVRLVAGEVSAQRGAAPEAAMMRAAADSQATETLPVGGWRIHALDGEHRLLPGEWLRRTLMRLPAIPVQRHYRLEGRGDATWGDARRAAPMPAAVELELEVPIDAETLPAGNLRVFDRDEAGRPRFLGAANIPAQPPESVFTVQLGQALGVRGVRQRTELRRLDRERFELGWRLEVHNGSDQPARVTLIERLQGDWSLIEGEGWTREDSETLSRSLDVAAGERVEVGYRVRLIR